MSKIEVLCDVCGETLERYPSEIRRRGGKGIYCSLSCAAVARNAPRRRKEIVMDCPCGKQFKTTTHNRAKKHCNRSCASKYSMSDERREAQSRAGLQTKNLISPAETLKRREAWKYVELEKALGGRAFEFEYELGGRVFDLALLDEKVLVEFDGPDHCSTKKTIEDDRDKELAAEAAGFIVVRRQVIPSTVIGVETIEGL